MLIYKSRKASRIKEMKAEILLKKAITKFTKEHPTAEIRSCFFSTEGSGRFGNWLYATFFFEYVDKGGGDESKGASVLVFSD